MLCDGSFGLHVHTIVLSRKLKTRAMQSFQFPWILLSVQHDECHHLIYKSRGRLAERHAYPSDRIECIILWSY